MCLSVTYMLCFHITLMLEYKEVDESKEIVAAWHNVALLPALQAASAP